MILVVGSTGNLGSEIVRQLRGQDQAVRAMVRKTTNPQKVATLKSLGATIVEGDLTERASLSAACRGVDTVITTATTTGSQTPGDSIPKVDQLGQLQLVEAAMETGVRRYIYMSYSRNINVDCPLTTAKRTVEERVIGSGMSYTILRPSYFMEVWLSPAVGFDYPNSQARIYGSGQNPISWISYADVARFTVMAVNQPAARNAILELGGPDKLSPNDVVKIFEQTCGKAFQINYVPVEALEGQKSATDDPLQQSFMGLMLQAMLLGDPIEMQGTLRSFPVKLTSVREYASRVVATVPYSVEHAA